MAELCQPGCVDLGFLVRHVVSGSGRVIALEVGVGLPMGYDGSGGGLGMWSRAVGLNSESHIWPSVGFI